MLLLCSFSRLKELLQVKNGLTMLLLFFQMPKIWVAWMTLNREKKEDGLREETEVWEVDANNND